MITKEQYLNALMIIKEYEAQEVVDNDSDIHEFSDDDKECIGEEIECNGLDIDDAVETVIRVNFRDIFEMNNWDEPNYTELDFEYEGNKYHMEIIEDGCCEASWDGRLMYWKFKFSKL